MKQKSKSSVETVVIEKILWQKLKKQSCVQLYLFHINQPQNCVEKRTFGPPIRLYVKKYLKFYICLL